MGPQRGRGLMFAVGRALLFMDTNWWWYGDLPEMELMDGFAWGAGAGMPIGDRWTIMAAAAFADRVIPTVDPHASASRLGSRRFGANPSLIVQRDEAAAAAHGIITTPTLVINDQLIAGFSNYDALSVYVRNAIEKATGKTPER